jgi:hypothetical protein
MLSIFSVIAMLLLVTGTAFAADYQHLFPYRFSTDKPLNDI